MQIKHSTDGLSIPHVSSTKKIFIANNDKSHRVCVCVPLAYGFSNCNRWPSHGINRSVKRNRANAKDRTVASSSRKVKRAGTEKGGRDSAVPRKLLFQFGLHERVKLPGRCNIRVTWIGY